MTATLTLHTFAMSHFSEKIRWTLDACAIPYVEHCQTPVFHMPLALRLGGRGQTTLPILAEGSRAIQDSPRILAWLAAERGPLPLLADTDREAVQAIERRFDAIGKDIARLLYQGSFGSADAHILELWTAHARPWQAALLRAGYPLVRWGFRRKLGISATRAQQAAGRITEQLDWLERELAGGKAYLLGERFGLADICVASLLAPLACPAEHPVYGELDYREGMRATLVPWRDRPALAWVRELYHRHRVPVTR